MLSICTPRLARSCVVVKSSGHIIPTVSPPEANGKESVLFFDRETSINPDLTYDFNPWCASRDAYGLNDRTGTLAMTWSTVLDWLAWLVTAIPWSRCKAATVRTIPPFIENDLASSILPRPRARY
jgi:hypothetical protein